MLLGRLLARTAAGSCVLLSACVLRVGGGGGKADQDMAASEPPISEPDATASPEFDASIAPEQEPLVEADAAPAHEPDAHVVDASVDASTPDATLALLDAHWPEFGDAAADAATDAAMTSDGGAQACLLSGSFATELLFDVSWNMTTIAGIIPLLAAGNGQIRMVMRLDLGGTPENMSARLTACGAKLPDFKASNALIGTENYAAYIPDSAWDHAEMPHPAFGLSFGCASTGCALSTDPVNATFGARTAPDDVWPGRSGPLRQITPVDPDADGRPGVLFVSRGEEERNALGMSYINIPVNWTLGARAETADIAFRITGMFNGKIDTCDLFTGVVSAGTVEARALGCRALRENAKTPFDCTAEQSAFLDDNLPAWQVRGGTFRVRRIAQDASCAAVREALR